MITPLLTKGDTIGIAATSCWIESQELQRAQCFFQTQGYNVCIHPQTTARHNQSAGTAIEKANALHDLFRNPDIKAIFGARGGNRASTILPHLDFDLIRHNPKIIMGYSDVTALLNPIYAQCDFATYHGPLFREMPIHPDYDQMIGILSGQADTIQLTGAHYLKPGDCHGTLIGGNLSVFQGLIGTPYMPETKGAILLLEDVGDHISRYDRMFCHLKNSGVLQNLAGLIIGSFTNVKDIDTNPFGFSLEDIILEHTSGFDYPILMNAPIGHGEKLLTTPIGANITLKNGIIYL